MTNNEQEEILKALTKNASISIEPNQPFFIANKYCGNFKIGDVVECLEDRFENIKLEVERILYDEEINRYWLMCFWFNENDEKRSDIFQSNKLKLIR